ncbi:MAG: CerR family C-terminal domain-containing protein [Rhodospirillum sp.]|nr:CerR family C-terminal domain-containing protein [Rhodospirillum sp.]MCF8489374.1 CerR family C-terminal domain-containing protein [Rhodospirillum sp.]MCF8501726.1 CerR family C-terminal domain-containing protein [Rhodospirillum sp.]
MDKRGDETRERILEAAILVFADRGFHGATIQMIVHGAKANQAAVNYHYGGKANLYATVMETAMSRLIQKRRDQLAHWLALPDPLEAMVRDLLSENTLDMSERERLHRLMAWEHLNPSGVAATHPKILMDEHFRAMCGVVAQETDRSLDDPSLARRAVWVLGQCMIFGKPGAVQMVLPPIGADLESQRTFIDETTTWLLPRIRAGLALPD